MRKSLNFGTDNIFFVNAGEPLRIFDLYNWRILDFNINRLHVYTGTELVSLIHESIDKEIHGLIKDEGKVEQAEVEQYVNDFLSGFNEVELSPGISRQSRNTGAEIFSPQKVSFWIRISDVPLESFFEEDYLESTSTGATKPEHVLPVNASLYLETLGEYEKALPVNQETPGTSFYLGMEDDTILTPHQLDVFDFLPLIDDYCGAFGASGDGVMINYTHHATLSRENMAAIPLYKHGSRHYVTFYFSLKTTIEHETILPLDEQHLADVLEILQDKGFQVVKQMSGNYILRRGDDVLHFYGEAEGKESLSGGRFLKPFILVAANDADMAPERRAGLLQQIKKSLA